MLKIKETGFSKTLATWINQAEQTAEIVAKGYISEAFRHILHTSPQYSGDFVANWNFSVGLRGSPSFLPYAVNNLHYATKKDGSQSKLGTLDVIYREGSRTAIDYALSNAKAELPGFRLGQSVFFTNIAHHNSDYYAFKIEDKQIKFRKENPSGGAVMLRTVGVMQLHYTSIGKTKAHLLMTQSL
jgi:hypothetical protein